MVDGLQERGLCHLARAQAEGWAGQVGVPACALKHACLFLVSHRAGKPHGAVYAKCSDGGSCVIRAGLVVSQSRATSPLAVFLLFIEVQLTN